MEHNSILIGLFNILDVFLFGGSAISEETNFNLVYKCKKRSCL